MSRWAWAEVDTDAIAHNVAVVAAAVAPAAVWAVVKANGYGHGAEASARAALVGGATGLCVALVQEGVALRDAGITDVPILVLSQQPSSQATQLVEAGLTPTVYSPEAIAAIAAAGATNVHLKIDTGMRRVGARPEDAVGLCEAIAASGLCLEGVFTHLAMADEPDDPATEEQLDRFDAVLAEIRAAGHEPLLVHAANSAGALAHPRARFDLVRLGIAMYGIEPGPGVGAFCGELQPALRLVARASHVKRVQPGDRVSYGLRHRFTEETTVATFPLGYADGVPRRLSSVGGEVLVRGERRPIVGVVTMDQLMVDCGDLPVEVGEEIVLLDRTIRPAEWAERLGTIAYEIVCGISGRIERRYYRR